MAAQYTSTRTESCNVLELLTAQKTQSNIAATIPSRVDAREYNPYMRRYQKAPLFEPELRLCSPHARSVLLLRTDVTCESTTQTTNNKKPVFDAASMYRK